jgi:hypothetical protein
MTIISGKLNYKGQKRIAIINAAEDFIKLFSEGLDELIIDADIDPRYPYNLIIIFAKGIKEVEKLTPSALHNLTADGILWFCYPKKTSKRYSSDLTRDYGWKPLNDSGFFGIRVVSIDEDWSAMRFRNIKYIKSTSGRFTSGA